MPRKYLIVLFFVAFVGARHAVPLQGLPLLSDTAFAATQENGQPCPPECVTDSLEIITYYPSPYGYYEELRGDKIIVGDTDNSHIDETHLPPSGTLTFEPLLDDPDASDGSLYEGSLYYQGAIGGTKGKFRFYDGSEWQDLGGSGGGYWKPSDIDSANIYYDTGNVGVGVGANEAIGAKLQVNQSTDAGLVVKGNFSGSLLPVTFNYTGVKQTYSVPTNVKKIIVTAYGAKGGDGGGNIGGLGGKITATIPVIPGETLDIYVGGKGKDATGSGGNGGFNGGGNGGGGNTSFFSNGGAGGGGATDLRRGATKLIVVGGGGGSGGNQAESNGGVGGSGGGTNGGGFGGGAGSLTDGGSGGVGGGCGSSSTGGKGGIDFGGNGAGCVAGGGGGGGGYNGGGGGGSGYSGWDSYNARATHYGGGGGGGGYSYAINTAINTSFTNGYWSGDGQMIITPDNSAANALTAWQDKNGGVIAVITNDGYLGVGTSLPSAALDIATGKTTLADAWSTRSSLRFKENLYPIDNALNKLSSLQGVYFDYKDTHKHSLGLVAEDVGKVFPELVTYETNGQDAISLDYDKLGAVTIEAVKEQQKEIEELKALLKETARSQQKEIELLKAEKNAAE